jgi:hypothetical protein
LSYLQVPAKGIVERDCACLLQQETNVRLQLRDTKSQGGAEPYDSALRQRRSEAHFCTRLGESVVPSAVPHLFIAQVNEDTSMEPVTLAVTVATLFFSEALKEGGKTLGKGVSDQATKLIHTVRDKFKASGTEGLLNRAELNPTQKHIDTVQDELATQMEEDNGYAAELQNLVNQLKAAGVVRQVMASGLEVEETLEAGDMTQTASGRTEVEQHMVTDVQAKNIKIGDMTQET